jgi:hypothetical protein
VLVMRNNDQQASQALLELFRAAREVPSAEYIVVDDGSSREAAMVREALSRLEHFFGVMVRYIQHSKPIGFVRASASGKQATHLLLNRYRHAGRWRG